MKRSTIAWGVAAAVALWSSTTFAQGRNFGGNWTVDQEKTMAAAAASGGGEVARIAAVGGGGGRGGGGAVMAGGGGGGAVVAGGEQRVAATGGAVAMRGGGGGRGGAGMGTPQPMAITLDANAFTVGQNSYKLDGTPTTTEMRGGVMTAKASWKGDKLVIEQSMQTQNGAIASTQTWYLEGDSLVRETSSPAPDGGAPRISRVYYKKS